MQACAGLTWGICGVVATIVVLTVFVVLYCLCFIIICTNSRWCRKRDKRHSQLVNNNNCTTRGAEHSFESLETEEATAAPFSSVHLYSNPPAYEDVVHAPCQRVSNDTASGTLDMTTAYHHNNTRSNSNDNLLLPSYEDFCNSSKSAVIVLPGLDCKDCKQGLDFKDCDKQLLLTRDNNTGQQDSGASYV